ncbi:MAG: glycosyltransferase [Glaciecola sp.]
MSNPKRHVLIVMHNLAGGGAEKMMVRLANHLVQQGELVSVLLIGSGGANTRALSTDIELFELHCSRTLTSFVPLRRAISEISPDAILSVLTHVNVITSIVCLSLGLGRILHCSERNTFSFDRLVNNALLMRFIYRIAPIVYRLQPNPVIAVSEGVRQDLIATTILRPCDVVVAPNPVITNDLMAMARQKPKHVWLSHKSLPVIVSVGRLAEQKGFDILLKAFKEVVASVDCRLIIFGEGTLRKPLEDLTHELGLSKYVSFPGYADNPIAEMNAADLFVLSSRFEGSPNVLVEAMSVGTKVVAFDCPSGPKEILNNGRIGSLVEYGNSSALTAAIVEQLEKNGRGKDDEVQKSAHARYSSENSAKNYVALLFRQGKVK